MALNIAPSEFFRGNDGPTSGGWSTFNVLLGTGPQQVELLPATSLSEILAVLPQGCPDTDPSGLDCVKLRGGNLNVSNDISWSGQTASNGDPYFELPFFSEQTLPGYDGAGEAGFDTVALDWYEMGGTVPQPLRDQIVVGYADPDPWLGMLGINGRPSHMFNATMSENSLLQSLVQNNTIGGLYWAYTAGASYTSPQTFGSLTLGGYDAGRFDNTSVLTIPFNNDSSLDLSVLLTDITISGSPSTIVSGLTNDGDSGLLMFIDSVVPEIWLPDAACESFEEAFGLVWNETVEMYLVNETQHAILKAQDTTITFTFAGRAAGSTSSSTRTTTTKITLPYDAFDCTATFPLAGIDDTSSQYYFPLKRAANDTQYFLGRTFLQGSYLMVDYNASQFHIAQALTPPGQVQLVTAYPVQQHPHKSNAGLIAGVAVGIVALVALLAGLCFWLWRRRQKRRPRSRSQSQQMDNDTVRTRTDSVGNTTVVGDISLDNRSSGNAEYFKPLMDNSAFPDEDYVKPELDATENARMPAGRGLERAELDASGFRPIHRHQHQTSWGSNGSNGSGTLVSPLPHPSPPMHGGGSSPSPPLSDRHNSGQFPPVLFEMP